MGEPVPVAALRPLSNAQEQMKLFSLSEEVTLYGCPEDEITKYLAWIKVNSRLYKAMFAKYANIARNKQPAQKLTFDQVKTNQESMNLTEVYAFLTDFSLNQGNLNNLKRDGIKRIIKLINLKQENGVGHTTNMDYSGFIELLL